LGAQDLPCVVGAAAGEQGGAVLTEVLGVHQEQVQGGRSRARKARRGEGGLQKRERGSGAAGRTQTADSRGEGGLQKREGGARVGRPPEAGGGVGCCGPDARRRLARGGRPSEGGGGLGGGGQDAGRRLIGGGVDEGGDRVGLEIIVRVRDQQRGAGLGVEG